MSGMIPIRIIIFFDFPYILLHKEGLDFINIQKHYTIFSRKCYLYEQMIKIINLTYFHIEELNFYENKSINHIILLNKYNSFIYNYQ